MNGTHLAAVDGPVSTDLHPPVTTVDDLPTCGVPGLRIAPAPADALLPGLRPVLADEADRALSLPRRVVDRDEAWPCAEEDFTPWLAGNLQVLGDELGLVLSTVGVDEVLDGFRFDVRALDADGRTVVVTNQLDGTDLALLGDCLAAAAAIEASVVVWVARHLRDDVRHAFDWLNERGDHEIRFFGVEVGVAQYGETGPRLPFFDVLSKPSGWTGARPSTRGLPSQEVGESVPNRARQDLFREVLVAVNTSRPSVQVPPRHTDRSWIDVAAGAFGAWSLAQVDGGRIRIEARLDTGDAARTTSLFELVAAQHEAWNRAVGFDLEFDRREGRPACRISVHHPPVDLVTMTTAERDALVVWLVRRFVAMHDVLDATLRGRARLLLDAVDPRRPVIVDRRTTGIA